MRPGQRQVELVGKRIGQVAPRHHAQRDEAGRAGCVGELGGGNRSPGVRRERELHGAVRQASASANRAMIPGLSILPVPSDGTSTNGMTRNRRGILKLDNMPASGNSMVLGKSNGAYELVVWAEPKVWNDATDTEISNPSQTVTVNLGGVHHSISVYDPLQGTTPIATYTDVSQIIIPLSDHPVIIEIDAPLSTSPEAPLPTAVSGTAAAITIPTSAGTRYRVPPNAIIAAIVHVTASPISG